ncbi:anti-sigma factor [Paractinoplanes globisporus]|uniref:Regulator of SigK n=1 Tax=Paractinoplanes globisporus TaxID=113565 RepID=A0ABW6W733_9ACTN|nr:anti-sigma factor [Actinoplanes globisporus]
MNTADVHTLLGPYVLDAVDDIERAAFDRHLRECDACRADVSELREASARLADGAWSVPPPGLRDNVLAAIGSVRQIAPISPAPAPAPATAPARSSRRLRLVSAAAAVVVAAAGAATAAYTLQDHRVRVEQARAEAAQAAESRVRALLASPDLVVKEEPVTGGGRVTVATSKLHDAGVIMLAADAAPSDGRVFQLWTIRSAVPIPEGTLAPGQTAAVQIVEGMGQASDVGVSVEPPGGSKTPTTPLAADVKL